MLIEPDVQAMLHNKNLNLRNKFYLITLLRKRSCNIVDGSPHLVDREIYAIVFTGALIITAIATTVAGDWSTLSMMSAKQVIILAFLGVFATGLGFFWWNKGAVVSKIATLAVFHNIKVPLAILSSLIIFGEHTDYERLILGGCVMFIAVYLSQKGFSSLLPNSLRKKEQPLNP